MCYHARKINKRQENTKLYKSAGKTRLLTDELFAGAASPAAEEGVSED
jgi:hypothetical protein